MALDAKMLRTAVRHLRQSVALAPPSLVDIALRHVREERLAPDEFIEATNHLPDNAVTRFADGIWSLVTDDKGNLLSFR